MQFCKQGSRFPRNTGMYVQNYTLQQLFIILNFYKYLKNLFCTAKHAINFITNCASLITSCPQVIIPPHNNYRQRNHWQTRQNIYKFRNLFIAAVQFTTDNRFIVKWCQPLFILLLDWQKTYYRVTHGNLTSFECVVLSRQARGGGGEMVGIPFLWVSHFQQDGATAHTANQSMTVVRNMFPRHLISRFRDVPWPLVLPIFQCVIFSFGGTWNRVFTLTNPAR